MGKDATFHNGERKPQPGQYDVSGAAAIAVTFLRNACKNGHHWTTEQQSGHKVCGWCNACDDPSCSPERAG